MHNMIGIRLSNKLYEKNWPNVSKNYDDLIVDEISRVCHPHWMLLMNQTDNNTETNRNKKRRDALQVVLVAEIFNREVHLIHCIRTNTHIYAEFHCVNEFFDLWWRLCRWLLKLLFDCLCPYSSCRWFFFFFFFFYMCDSWPLYIVNILSKWRQQMNFFKKNLNKQIWRKKNEITHTPKHTNLQHIEK